MEKSHARGPPDTKLVSHAYDDFPRKGKLVIGMEKSHARGPPDTKLVSHAYDDFPRK
jgi:hypothetical protein